MTLAQAKKKIEKQVIKIREAKDELNDILESVLDGLESGDNGEVDNDVVEIFDLVRSLYL